MSLRTRKVQVGAKIDPNLEKLLSERAALVPCTKSQYLEAIINYWFANGAQSVHPKDNPPKDSPYAPIESPLVPTPNNTPAAANEAAFEALVRPIVERLTAEKLQQAAEEGAEYGTLKKKAKPAATKRKKA